jgi:hypothetical protein
MFPPTTDQLIVVGWKLTMNNTLEQKMSVLVEIVFTFLTEQLVLFSQGHPKLSLSWHAFIHIAYYQTKLAQGRVNMAQLLPWGKVTEHLGV